MKNIKIVTVLFFTLLLQEFYSQTQEYISFFHWANGQTTATNWQSDSDPVYFGAIGSKNGCVFADINITNSGVWNATGGPFPRYAYNSNGMPANAGFGTRLDVDWTNTNQQVVYTITLKDGNAGPISEFLTSFSIYDINAHVCATTAANRFIDEVVVVGYRANLTTTVNPTLTPVLNSGGILCTDNQITGNVIKGSPNCGFSRVNVSFGTTPVARVQLIYRSGVGHPANQNCGANPSPLALGDNPRSQFISLSSFAVTGGGVNLPVEFNRFSASCIGGQSKLEWSTFTELNNDYYTIERSSDGVEFETIATVKGGGTVSHFTEYEWIDNRPYLGISYYRLSQTDFDGTHTVLETISYQNSCEDQNYLLFVYPNPLSQSSVVRLETNHDANVSMQLLDQSGRLIKTILPMQFVVKNIHEVNLESEDLSSGIYLLQVTINGQIEIVKIVK